jgi:hypothetical protein
VMIFPSDWIATAAAPKSAVILPPVPKPASRLPGVVAGSVPPPRLLQAINANVIAANSSPYRASLPPRRIIDSSLSARQFERCIATP